MTEYRHERRGLLIVRIISRRPIEIVDGALHARRARLPADVALYAKYLSCIAPFIKIFSGVTDVTAMTTIRVMLFLV